MDETQKSTAAETAIHGGNQIPNQRNPGSNAYLLPAINALI